MPNSAKTNLQQLYATTWNHVLDIDINKNQCNSFQIKTAVKKSHMKFQIQPHNYLLTDDLSVKVQIHNP